jgi:hypothetical protein
MIFSENRYQLFGIMLKRRKTYEQRPFLASQRGRRFAYDMARASPFAECDALLAYAGHSRV